MNTLKCLRCGEEWTPKVTRPKYCPACKQRKWDVEARPKEGGEYIAGPLPGRSGVIEVTLVEAVAEVLTTMDPVSDAELEAQRVEAADRREWPGWPEGRLMPGGEPVGDIVSVERLVDRVGEILADVDVEILDGIEAVPKKPMTDREKRKAGYKRVPMATTEADTRTMDKTPEKAEEDWDG